MNTINICKNCQHQLTRPCYTSDSFERPEDWFCVNEIVKQNNGGEPRKISGYVEWRDKIPVPLWCPLYSNGCKGEETPKDITHDDFIKYCQDNNIVDKLFDDYKFKDGLIEYIKVYIKNNL